MAKQRVISLLPGATEIVCALGAADRLVGRSHECDFPAQIASLPVCTAAKMDSSANSAEIERQVKELAAQGTALYRLEQGKIRELRPDVIITQAQCEVCAVSLSDVQQAVAQLPEPRPKIVSLAPNKLEDIWEDIRRVAAALDLADHGRAVLRALKTRVVAIIEKACLLKQPGVACIEWIEPLMAAGNWVPTLVELAGGKNLFGAANKHSYWMTWDALQKADPEVIVLMPCGFNLRRTQEETLALARQPGWPNLRAVKARRVYAVDGNSYFNRPGPRVVESLEILAEIFHGDRFNFGHRGKAWEKL